MVDHPADLVRDGDYVYAIHRDDGKFIRFYSPLPKQSD